MKATISILATIFMIAITVVSVIHLEPARGPQEVIH